MNTTILAFVLTTIAGLSTIIGTFIIFVRTNNKNKIIASSLAFASAVMIAISITDLIPESVKLLSYNYNAFSTCFLCFLFVVLGILLSMIIDYYLPSNKENGLYRVGMLAMLAIIFHNIPEGCSCYVS